MFNPVDTRQIRALIDHRRQQVASDEERVRQSFEPQRPDTRRVGRLRLTAGMRLMRLGARIAGMYIHDLPQLRPGA